MHAQTLNYGWNQFRLFSYFNTKELGLITLGFVFIFNIIALIALSVNELTALALSGVLFCSNGMFLANSLNKKIYDAKHISRKEYDKFNIDLNP